MAYTLYSNLDWIDLPDCMGLLEDGNVPISPSRPARGLMSVLQDQGGPCAEPYASLWKHRFPGRGAAKAHCWEILSGREALAEMSGERGGRICFR